MHSPPFPGRSVGLPPLLPWSISEQQTTPTRSHSRRIAPNRTKDEGTMVIGGGRDGDAALELIL